jgi:hypothetical protein
MVSASPETDRTSSANPMPFALRPSVQSRLQRCQPGQASSDIEIINNAAASFEIILHQPA